MQTSLPQLLSCAKADSSIAGKRAVGNDNKGAGAGSSGHYVQKSALEKGGLRGIRSKHLKSNTWIGQEIVLSANIAVLTFTSCISIFMHTHEAGKS